MESKKFGLIGRTLKHSYSKIIHQKLGEYPYELYELEPNELKDFVCSDMQGFNVTIPYKKDVMQYLDSIDEHAKSIGAVNTVVKKDGKILGYNTDFKGMLYMLNRAGISLKDRSVLILGSGGTSNTSLSVASFSGAKKITVVSRSGKINYQNCYDLKDTEVIINTTPVGMYPNTDDAPVDISRFEKLIGVVDAIYNPELTRLLMDAKEKGLKYTSGLPMLVAQAKYASELFLGTEIADSEIERIINLIRKDTENVVLIGMPGSGKSTIGEILSKELGREFIDTDLEIVKRENRTIAEIFARDGEKYFRKVESQVLKDVGKLSGKIIATGGGVVKDKKNYFSIKCNGKIFYIDRPVKDLSTIDRPLSKDQQTLINMYEERKGLYEYFADYSIKNDSDILDAVKGVLDNL